MGELRLPAGYVAEGVLARRGGVTVVRARQGEALRVLRLDERPAAEEGLAELAVLATVEHPGIARLVDHGVLPGGGSYLAREWVPGVDLFEHARDCSPEAVGRIVAQLCSALDHLHGAGFVHGDLKPENVLVGPEERVVLSDFGFARPLEEPPETAAVRGTLFALAPEVLLGVAPTERSDLFALGALLHRLLVGQRRTAREFYADFPRSSFLDAAGSAPEDLPVWARDLVVALTAREPAQRPPSAGWVGRLLATRLGLEPGAIESRGELRWPVGYGRESWLAEWHEQARAGEGPLWVRVPEGEEPDPLWRHLRLYAALRGRASRGIDLAQELVGLGHAAALDDWARTLAAGADAWLFVCLGDDEPWTRRAVVSLERACRQVGAETETTLVVVAAHACAEPAGEWAVAAVPPVAEPTVVQFLSTRLEEEEERVAAFAALASSAARGSATRLDRWLSGAGAAGLVLASRAGFCLRPGALAPEVGRPAGDASTLDPAAARLLGALQVCGERATLSELVTATGLEYRRLGAAFQTLVSERRVQLTHRHGPASAVVTAPADFPPEHLRSLHGERARALEARDPTDPRIAVHRFCQAAASEVGGLVEVLVALRDRGASELGLELADRALVLARAAGWDPIADAPELLAESASVWCALGRTDQAERVLAELEPARDARVGALVELVRARIDAVREEPERALARYERAAELDPRCSQDAALGRIHLLHASGRDREVCDELAALDLTARERRGELESRQRALLESLGAMSAFRLGSVEEARSTIERLVEEAGASGDFAREASLRINLATIERRAGSQEHARAELHRAVESFAHIGNASGRAHALQTLGGLERELGNLIEAERLLVEAMEIRERIGEAEGATTARGTLGLTWFERGHVRAALETLEETAASLRGAHRLRFAPLLTARADELAARIGQAAREAERPHDDEADPRAFLSRAREAWLRGDAEGAASLAERADTLATSLRLGHVALEARFLVGALSGEHGLPGPEAGPLLRDDVRALALLARTGDEFDEHAAEELARELSLRGRDDRAARVWYALAARTRARDRIDDHAEQARTHFERAALGLTDAEREAFRLHLFGIPDPWPGDFAPRPKQTSSDEELEMEVISLLDINRRLVEQQDLRSLLGVIVESALSVAGAERGFLMLEDRRELRFDTALDSSRGDIARPEIEVSHSVVQETLERMEPIRVSNAVDDPLLGRAPSVATLELRSILCVPFVVDPELRGAIYVDHRLRTGAFDERAERLCNLLANQAALAIQQIRRLEEIRRLNKELSQQVVEQEASLRTARRTLRDAGINDPVGGLVGSSQAMRGVHELLQRAAPSDLSVLVVGQTGTGKELAARSLHELSARRKQPFVAESCSALPASLIESELFGYRRGAFTGADRDREGLIERANGGTLFLDEIGELPLELQAKLLRVLETSEVRRIGESEPRSVDFRLVVATNRDLEREVREGGFREDLFYRLDGIRVAMPALAERAEDIPELVDYFLRIENEESGATRRASRAVVARLGRRRWPGNVRELKNEIARLCVLSEGDLDDPALIRDPAPTRTEEADSELSSLAELERRAIERALERTGGDKRRAAKILGISRAKVYQRLREWAEEAE